MYFRNYVETNVNTKLDLFRCNYALRIHTLGLEKKRKNVFTVHKWNTSTDQLDMSMCIWNFVMIRSEY